MYILIILAFVLVFIVLIVVSTVARILSFFTPKGMRTRGRGSERTDGKPETSPQTEKVFSEDEGEYVSYEEIKEE